MLREYEGNIWEHQAWEKDAAYAGFLAYRDCGSGRSIDEAFRRYTETRESQKSGKKRKKAEKSGRKAQKKTEAKKPKVSSSFRKWKTEYEWDERIRAFDNFELKEIDAAKLAAKKEAEIEILGKMKEAALAATVKMLEKPSLEKVRKRYSVVKNMDGQDVQTLKEVITDQQSVFATEGMTKFVLQSLMPEIFGKKDKDEKKEETQIVIVRDVISGTQSEVYRRAEGNISLESAG